jgi:hypothetical protein
MWSPHAGAISFEEDATARYGCAGAIVGIKGSRLTEKSRRLLMSLKDTVEFLNSGGDEPLSRYIRAVRLFEFEVSIIYPRSFKRLIASPSSVIAPTGVLKTARILAISKILENIQGRPNQPSSIAISIRNLAADQVYQGISDQLFVPNGGWNQILSSKSAKSFDDRITKRLTLAQTAANIIDFSCRFSKEPPQNQPNRRKNLGGLETAKFIVRNSSGTAASDSTIKSRWRDYGSTAIFLYLILHHKFNLVPPKVQSAEFVDKLLDQADNRNELQSFFSAYHTVHADLSNLKYKLPAVDFAKWRQPTQLNIPRLSPEMRDLLSKWIQIG